MYMLWFCALKYLKRVSEVSDVGLTLTDTHGRRLKRSGNRSEAGFWICDDLALRTHNA